MAMPLFDRDAKDFTHLGARASDPSTSHEAAAGVDGAGDRRRAFDALAEHGPLTDFELGDLIDRQQTSAGKRRKELEQAGLVVRTDDRRETPSGSTAAVWALTDEGLALAASGAPWRLVRSDDGWSVA